MSVFVDDMRAKYGRMIMCHMGADTTEELLEMIDKIGVQRRYIQYQGTWKEHFDISLGKKMQAIDAGAIQMTRKQFVSRMMLRSTTDK